MLIAKLNLITGINMLEGAWKTMAGISLLRENSYRPDLHHRIPTTFGRQSNF